MAYVPTDPNLLDEEEEERRRQETVPGTSAPGDGGEAPVDAGPGGGTTAAGIEPFTNINAYLDANREQAAELSGKLAGKLTEEEQKIRGDIGKTGEETQAQIAQNRVSADEGLVNRALEKPTDFVKNQADLEAFTKMRDASYQGPRSIAENRAAELSGQVREGQRRAGLVDTEEGRSELLRLYGNNPTQGQVMLDQLLLGADPNSRQTLSAAANPFSSLDEYLDEVSGQARTAGEAADSDATAARNLVSSRLSGEGGAIPAFQSDLQRRLAQRKDQEVQELAAMKQGLSNFYLTPEQMTGAGLTQEELIRMRDKNRALANHYQQPEDVLQFLTERSPDEAYTVGNVATPEDVARYNALAQLAGITPDFLTDGRAAPANLYDFDARSAGRTIGDKLYGLDESFLRMDPSTMSPEEQQRYLSVGHRTKLAGRADDGTLSFLPGGGFGYEGDPDFVWPGGPPIGYWPGPAPDSEEERQITLWRPRSTSGAIS
jgi:hypothetical protein